MFNLIQKIFAKQIKDLESVAASNAVAQYRKESLENKNNFRKIEAEIWLGKPIIALSNEWNEPIVGELLKIEEFKNNSFGYVYQNYLTGKETFTLVNPFAFSEQKLKILGKLNPDEYCCLFYEGTSHFGEFRKHPNYGKEREQEFTNYENWIIQLNNNGFYEKFGEFLKIEEENAKIHLKSLAEQYGPFNY